jgi:hypothetical protein
MQAGEYVVTYTKMVSGNPNPESCTFPLEVGAPGLRIELTWEHTPADPGVDIDLHVHQPADTRPWAVSPGGEQDCGWATCKVGSFTPPQASTPNWFAQPPVTPPSPVNWDDTTPSPPGNECYFAPQGAGQKWALFGQGCHNPRLDSDNITCDDSVTDPTDPNFCLPDNVNIDYPPTGQWMRIGVHYFSNHGLTYDVHPQVKVFCNGPLAAYLGPHGYGVPEAPATFAAGDGAGRGVGNKFWVVADVAFVSDGCGGTYCEVRPAYADATQRTPYFTVDTTAVSTFAPPYPPPP